MASRAPSDIDPAAMGAVAAGPRVGRKMAKGAGWTIAMRLSVQGIGLLSTIILARLLVPEDFGLVALATTFSAALVALSEFSFEVVLIQNQRAGRSYYDTAWTLQLMRNATLASVLAIGAAPFAALLGDARIEDILYCLAAVALAEGFQNIGIVNFRKHFKFHLDFAFMVGGKLAMIVTAVPLAYFWGNYWALVAGIAAGAAMRITLSYAMQAYRPWFALTKWRAIFRFSKWLVLNQAGQFVFERSDTFAIGKIIGAQGVGVYSVAFEIANLATSTLLAPMRRAVLPGFAAVANDMEGLRQSYADVLAFALMMATPVAVGIGLVAEPLVQVALGKQWLASIPLIQILALYGFLSVANAGSAPVMLALGRPHFLSYILAASITVMIPLLILGTRYAGAVGAAWAVTTSVFVTMVLGISIVVRLLQMPLRHLVAVAWRPIVAIAAMAAAVLQIRVLWPAPSSVFDWLALLLVSAAAGAAVYIGVVAILWFLVGRPNGAERHLLDAARELAGRYLTAQNG